MEGNIAAQRERQEPTLSNPSVFVFHTDLDRPQYPNKKQLISISASLFLADAVGFVR
jgi:hypothetical protein